MEAEKDKLLVLFDTDEDGIIYGWQQEFWDGHEWQVPFDTTNAVQIDKTELGKVTLRASKVVDGKVVVDQDKFSELQAASAPQPTPEQQLLISLADQVAKLKAGKV